jgi:predicted site-specific integrase-resolvase
MLRRYTPDHVAKLFGVTKGTVIGWCVDGTMPAVNVARASAKRKRWRMSEEDIATFEARRQNKVKTAAPELRSSRRTIQRPTKDYFATASAGGK